MNNPFIQGIGNNPFIQGIGNNPFNQGIGNNPFNQGMSSFKYHANVLRTLEALYYGWNTIVKTMLLHNINICMYPWISPSMKVYAAP